MAYFLCLHVVQGTFYVPLTLFGFCFLFHIIDLTKILNCSKLYLVLLFMLVLFKLVELF